MIPDLGALTRHQASDRPMPGAVRILFTLLQQALANSPGPANPGGFRITHARFLQVSHNGWNPLWAVRTSRGAICAVVGAPAWTDHCFFRLSHGVSLALDHRGPGCPDALIASGLAANDVRAVRLTAGSITRRADIRGNGFVATLPSSVGLSGVDSITVYYRDGASRVIHF